MTDDKRLLSPADFDHLLTAFGTASYREATAHALSPYSTLSTEPAEKEKAEFVYKEAAQQTNAAYRKVSAAYLDLHEQYSSVRESFQSEREGATLCRTVEPEEDPAPPLTADVVAELCDSPEDWAGNPDFKARNTADIVAEIRAVCYGGDTTPLEFLTAWVNAWKGPRLASSLTPR